MVHEATSPEPEHTAPRRRGPRARSPELTVLLLALAAGLPGVFVTFVAVSGGGAPEWRTAVIVAVVGVWIAAAFAARAAAKRTLIRVADILNALSAGHYSVRGLSARRGSSMAAVMRELNHMAVTLERQRAETVESTQLLTHVMKEIELAVFAFEPPRQLLLLVNRAGERLMGKTAGELVGSPASALGLDDYLTGDSRRLVDRPFGATHGRFEVRRATFYREGRPHHLLVVADLSQALREEEQLAWQRIVRVLSHEINNSLTPIKSIAHSLRRIVARTGGFPRDQEVQQGLALIEARSGALGRFLRAYAQLARLPNPDPRPLDVLPLVSRVAQIEKRMPIRIQPSPAVKVQADADQIEQLLINLVRNAVDASLETQGHVSIGWEPRGEWVEFAIEDEGRGLADKSNLFVPFFTTKPSGSGIGLVLCRQIAEAHGGTIILENRVGGPGCRATVRLPQHAGE